MVASRNAGAHPFFDPERIDSTSSSACVEQRLEFDSGQGATAPADPRTPLAWFFPRVLRSADLGWAPSPNRVRTRRAPAIRRDRTRSHRTRAPPPDSPRLVEWARWSCTRSFAEPGLEVSGPAQCRPHPGVQNGRGPHTRSLAAMVFPRFQKSAEPAVESTPPVEPRPRMPPRPSPVSDDSEVASHSPLESNSCQPFLCLS